MLTKSKTTAMVIAFAATIIVFLGANPVAAVDPVFVPGNPSCTDLGYDFAFKPQPEPPPSGTYTFPDGIHELTISSDGSIFDWTSDLGLDAVIVKGGSNANVYIYDPESFGDNGLHSPINPNNNKPYAISHIEVCYDYEVDVEKTAETTYTRTHTWSIDKSVDPASWSLFEGDSGTSEYTVAVEKTGYTDSDWAVSGDITVTNDTPFDTVITGVTDEMTGGITAPVDCGVAFPYTLLTGEYLVCTYSAGLPDGSTRTNTAIVATDPAGIVGGDTAEATVEFGEPTTTVNDSITVVDTNGGSWSFGDSGFVQYTRTFSCDGDEGSHDNVATIVETGQSDSATVTVACFELNVTKNASTAYTRTWDWSIDKMADQEALTLSPGQAFTVSYQITLDATAIDSDWGVEGDIWISNTNPAMAASLVSVSDVITGGTVATVECPLTVVPAGGSLHCTYFTSLPDGSNQTNTATATLQNVSISADGSVSPTGTTDFSGSAPVNFGDPETTVDTCVEIADTFAEFTGQNPVCVDGGLPAIFDYTWQVGPYSDPEDCGEQLVVNTASFSSGDTGVTGSDEWTITVTVPCENGCTLTPGYWKTHSIYGPAPYDDTWTAIGEDTDFFYAVLEDGSIQSYYEVLWTPPQGGNAYYILAHAYIAAVLNGENGASAPSEIGIVMDLAEQWFNDPEHTPAYALDLKGKKGAEERAMLLMYAALLDAYNNGEIGPGHCSE